MIDSVDKLFDTLGGPAKVGSIIGKSTEHAASMRRRGSIPVDYWPPLVAAAASRKVEGLTFEALTRMHVKSEAVSRVRS
jgi:hypothetical protein